MKLPMVLGCAGVLLLCSCSNQQTQNNTRHYIRQFGNPPVYEGRCEERFPSVLITDGGSTPVPFLTVDGRMEELILDCSISDNPTNRSTPRQLRWGYSKVEKNIPLDYNSDLARELLQSMVAYLAEQRDPSEDFLRLQYFIWKIADERDKAWLHSLESKPASTHNLSNDSRQAPTRHEVSQ